jgi:signal transduction histidine kinase
MTELAAAPGTTVQLIRRVSSRAEAGISPTVLLERVCEAVVDALAFDRIAGVRYHTRAGEVSEVAVAGIPSSKRAERRPLASVPLLAEALDAQNLVLAADWRAAELTWAFALPLISGERCLGFLTGKGRQVVPPDESEVEALATLGIVVAALLDGALAREEAQRLDVLKTEFVALAAHELRNPLTGIYGICLTLDERGEALAEQDRRALSGALREQTARMRTLIEQLLDLSRFDLAAIEVAPVPVRLRPRIEELVSMAAGARAEAVTVAVASDLDAVVDPSALDRMLSNLVANALRHGEPPVTVTAARRDTHLRLAVEDRGEGVRPEFVPRLFDRFTRGPEAQAQTGGAGLGLAIARAYARAHGGDIVYEPAMPHGARFEVVLPVRAEEGRVSLRQRAERAEHGPADE